MITIDELEILHRFGTTDVRALVVEVRRLNTIVDMVRKLDGNSYPVAGLVGQRQSVDRTWLQEIREAIEVKPVPKPHKK